MIAVSAILQKPAVILWSLHKRGRAALRAIASTAEIGRSIISGRTCRGSVPRRIA